MGCSPWSRRESGTTARPTLTYSLVYRWGFPGGTSGKEPELPVQKTEEVQVQSLGQEDLDQKSHWLNIITSSCCVTLFQ